MKLLSPLILLISIYYPMMPMQGDSPQLLELFIDPPEAERSMLPLITRRPVLTRDALAAQAEASGGTVGGLTCFSSFVAGSGSLHTSMQRTRALPFRYVMALHQCRLKHLLVELVSFPHPVAN